MQVNQALTLLLDLLVEEFWDIPGTLEVLLCHLPSFELTPVLTEASTVGYVTYAYERSHVHIYHSQASSVLNLMCM